MTITLPVDFTESLEFRRLREICRSKAETVSVFLSVFQNLGYLAREGSPVGRITASDVPIFCKDLQSENNDAGPSNDLFLKLCDSVKLLVRDGSDFYCPMFERYNRASQNADSFRAAGGKIKAFERQIEKATKGNLQQTLELPKELLVDADNKSLDSDMVMRLRNLITRCDLALGKKSRPEPLYTAELIQSALVVLKKFDDNQIMNICRVLVKNRASPSHVGHPALLGMTTEKLLPRFGEMESALEA